MNEINCPHCKKAFKVDQAGYADIIKQVRIMNLTKNSPAGFPLPKQTSKMPYN